VKEKDQELDALKEEMKQLIHTMSDLRCSRAVFKMCTLTYKKKIDSLREIRGVQGSLIVDFKTQRGQLQQQLAVLAAEIVDKDYSANRMGELLRESQLELEEATEEVRRKDKQIQSNAMESQREIKQLNEHAASLLVSQDKIHKIADTAKMQYEELLARHVSSLAAGKAQRVGTMGARFFTTTQSVIRLRKVKQEQAEAIAIPQKQLEAQLVVSADLQARLTAAEAQATELQKALLDSKASEAPS
jgi:hypothetical protein